MVGHRNMQSNRCWEPPPSFYVIALLIVSVYLHRHEIIIGIYPVHWQFSYNVLVGQGQRGDLGLLKNGKHNLMTARVCVYFCEVAVVSDLLGKDFILINNIDFKLKGLTYQQNLLVDLTPLIMQKTSRFMLNPGLTLNHQLSIRPFAFRLTTGSLVMTLNHICHSTVILYAEPHQSNYTRPAFYMQHQCYVWCTSPDRCCCFCLHTDNKHERQCP